MPKPRYRVPRVQGATRLPSQLQSMPTDVRAAVAYIVDSLQDYNNPAACAGTLHCCLRRIAGIIELSSSGTVDARVLLSKLHGLWFALYDFITAQRTDAEFQAMTQKLSTCSCRMTLLPRMLHQELGCMKEEWTRKSVLDGDGSFCLCHLNRSDTWKFIHLSSSLLRRIMNVAKDSSVTKGVSKRWPPSMPELFPHGSDTLIKSLLQWQQFVGDFVVFDLFGAIFRFCGPHLCDSISKFDAVNSLIIRPIRQQVDRMIATLVAAITNPKLRPAHSDFSDLVFGLDDCLAQIFRPPIKMNVNVLNGQEIKALELCSLVLYLISLLEPPLTPDDVKYLTVILAGTAHRMFFSLGLHLPGRRNIPLHPSIVAIENKLLVPVGLQASRGGLERPMYDFVGLAITECLKNKACGAPGCQLTFKNEGVTFKKCARCATVGYCSRACQIHHWSFSDSDGNDRDSHKRVCKVINRLVTHRDVVGLDAVEHQEGDDDRVRSISLQEYISQLITEIRGEGGMTDDELVMVMAWARRTVFETDSLGEMSVNENPGFEDYDDVINILTRTHPTGLLAPKAEYIKSQPQT